MYAANGIKIHTHTHTHTPNVNKIFLCAKHLSNTKKKKEGARTSERKKCFEYTRFIVVAINETLAMKWGLRKLKLRTSHLMESTKWEKQHRQRSTDDVIGLLARRAIIHFSRCTPKTTETTNKTRASILECFPFCQLFLFFFFVYSPAIFKNIQKHNLSSSKWHCLLLILCARAKRHTKYGGKMERKNRNNIPHEL